MQAFDSSINWCQPGQPLTSELSLNFTPQDSASILGEVAIPVYVGYMSL